MINGIPVRVIDCDCSDCREELVADCNASGLGPAGEYIYIPSEWVTRVCPHGRIGFRFERVFDPDDELDGPNIDATRNRGYWAREDGRFGSHPSHDGFDDEGEP